MSKEKRSAVLLGITGGIACGKSEAGRFLGELGFDVCDADYVAHRLMEKGMPVYERVVADFGRGVLDDNGALSRPRLAAVVFSDPAGLERLNRLVHPAVRDELAAWMATKRTAGCRAAALVPLLFESGMQELGWDAVLCISSRYEEVIARLAARGLTREEADKRIVSQMPLAEKERRSDYVVLNDGTPGELKAALRRVVAAIEGEREL